MQGENDFFVPGDLVIVNKDIANKPQMVVKEQSRTSNDFIGKGKGGKFLGVKCWWFTDSLDYKEQTFNTKDLERVD